MEYMFFTSQMELLYPNCICGLFPTFYYCERERGNWERVNQQRTNSHEGEISRLLEDCRPFSSHRPVLLVWMDLDMDM